MSREEAIEQSGWLADTLDNLRAALTLPMPDALHVQALRESFPSLVTEARAIHVALSGDDLWSEVSDGR